MTYIGLLDCNNFFVSCERLFRPDLVKRPVVVLSGNDGCIVARSNEVKELGVAMGIPYFQAKEQLTQAQTAIFSSNFPLYRDISTRVMQTLRTMVSVCEVYSVDEAFFIIEAASTAEAEAQGIRIKTQVEAMVGLPVSVGIAKTKTIAKYASETAKQRARAGSGPGVAVWTGESWQKQQGDVALADIWGVGGALAKKYTMHGITTVSDLIAADQGRIAQLFGVGGTRLRDELREQVVWPVGSRATGTQKSIMSTRSFGETTTKRHEIEQALTYHVTQAAADLRALGMECRYIQVIAAPSRHSDWVLRQRSADCFLDVATNDTRTVLKAVLATFATFYDPEVPYKKAGVVLGYFTPTGTHQASLFDNDADTEKGSVVMSILDGLNSKFGRDTITVGRTATAQSWQAKHSFVSPAYTTRWSDIQSVRA